MSTRRAASTANIWPTSWTVWQRVNVIPAGSIASKASVSALCRLGRASRHACAAARVWLGIERCWRRVMIGASIGPSPCRAARQVERTTITADGPVVVLGTGLSMVDVFLSLDDAGHKGRIVALSRRGLIPAIHFQGKPHKLDAVDIPFGATPAQFMRWLRKRIATTKAAGGDWRDVMDALRPFTQKIWSSWTHTMRAQFFTTRSRGGTSIAIACHLPCMHVWPRPSRPDGWRSRPAN